MSDRVTGREVHLAARPQGEPQPGDFRVVEADVPEPRDGEVVIRNLFMSVDPYMRPRMNDVKSYVPPFKLDAVLDGGAVGEVVTSRSPRLEPGDAVLHQYGWREYAVAEAGSIMKVDPSLAPLSAYLGVLGMPGLTAYVGLLDIAQMKPGDAVFVSGAAGCVGGLVGQIARLRGASRVVGSAGSDEKVEHLQRTLGFDAAFNYRSGRVNDLLHEAAPEGIDVYFDNVGGDHLEAAIFALHTHGRVAMCGAISAYSAAEPPTAPRNLALAIGRRLTLRGFIISDHFARTSEMIQEVAPWLREGRIHAPETVVEGIENAPSAFIGLLRGENMGKMLVKLS